MSPPRIDRIAAATVAAAVLLCAACGGDGPTNTSRASATPGSDRVADSECDRTPADGTRTQAVGGLRLTRGMIRVRITQRASNPAPEPKQGDGDTTARAVCLGFDRWGDPNPLVPVDSVLLAFSDSAGSGVTVDVPLVELVSRRSEITGTVWVVGDGVRLQAPSCTVRPRTVTEREVSATFECPDAMPVESNPFAPDDRIDPSDRSPETPTPTPSSAPATSGPTPSSPAPSPTPPAPAAVGGSASLQGWFAVGQ